MILRIEIDLDNADFVAGWYNAEPSVIRRQSVRAVIQDVLCKLNPPQLGKEVKLYDRNGNGVGKFTLTKD